MNFPYHALVKHFKNRPSVEPQFKLESGTGPRVTAAAGTAMTVSTTQSSWIFAGISGEIEATYLAHAGEAGVVCDDADEHFLALVGAVLVIGS